MNHPKVGKQINMVVMPRSGRSFYSLVISHKLIYAGAAALILLIGVNACILSSYFKMKSKVSESQRLIKVGMEVSSLKEEAESIKEDLDYIKQANSRIQLKTGITSEPGYADHEYDNREVAMPTRSLPPEVEAIRDQLRVFQAETEARKRVIHDTDKRIDTLMQKYSIVPSIWPVRGEITSGFGYRVHPVLGVREFHMGVDIKGDTSTPIHATADGVVDYAGWRNGYGQTVMIQHPSGYETLYGHTSRILVEDGEKVKKGQIVAYVGCTGLCTGDHVHYEVHSRTQLLNPVRFLNLTLKDMEQF